MTELIYHDPFPLGEDHTRYSRLEGSEQYVSTDSFAGTEMLKVAPEALCLLARTALHDVSFFLRLEWGQALTIFSFGNLSNFPFLKPPCHQRAQDQVRHPHRQGEHLVVGSR